MQQHVVYYRCGEVKGCDCSREYESTRVYRLWTHKILLSLSRYFRRLTIGFIRENPLNLCS